MAVNAIEPFEAAQRAELDVLLAEFQAIRSEIDLAKAQLERTYAFLFATVAAIAASQLLSQHSVELLNHHPWIFLGAAVLALWFPVNNLLMAVDMTSCGAYIREVLQPRINSLTALMSPTGATLTSAVPVATFMATEDRARITGPLAWEEFMPLFRLGLRRRRFLFIPLYAARAGLLYVPTGLFLARFFTESPPMNPVELILLAAMAGVTLLTVAARFSVGSMIRYGLRKGPFRAKP